ncbi:MAG: hypothetical protein ACOH1V_04950 [Stenotrophomonas sp.]
MNSPLVLAVVIAAAVLIGSVRLWRQRGPTRTRRALLIVLQALLGGLLYFTLQPPPLPGQAGTLLVATAGTDPRQLQTHAAAVVIALPETPVLAGVTREPDLATALRRHPGMQRLRIVGNGLEPRDLGAATNLPLAFDPPSLPRGWVTLQPPATVAPGARFSVSARALGVENAQAELVDPAGRRVDIAALDKEGNVQLSGTARARGQTLFSLRLIDADGQTVEALPVPLQVSTSAAPRIWVLASAPGPELKYLRRWASDAGLQMHTQMAAGGGLQLGDAPRPFTASTLAATDLLLLDERSFAALGPAQRAVLREAINNGLGLLLRLGGAVPEATRNALRGFGLSLRGDNQPTAVALHGATQPADVLAARRGPQPAPHKYGDHSDGNVPALERVRTDATGSQAVPLLHDAAGKPLGAWTTQGSGRIGVLPLSDSFSWVLAGRDDLHGELWSQVFSTLARPLPAETAPPVLPSAAWAGERLSLCALGKAAAVLAPDGERTSLQRDPATGTSACAGYWPQQPGWHALVQGEQRWPFLVFAADEAVSMHRYRQREATLQLAGNARSAAITGTPTPRPGRRWPWLLGFLACAALLWWLERRRPATQS